MTKTSPPQEGAEQRCPSCGEQLYMGGGGGVYVGFGDDALAHAMARTAAAEHTAYACRNCGTLICKTCADKFACTQCGDRTFDRFDLRRAGQVRAGGTSALAELAEQVRAEQAAATDWNWMLPTPEARARQYQNAKPIRSKPGGRVLWVIAAVGVVLVLIVLGALGTIPSTKKNPTPAPLAYLSPMEEVVDPASATRIPVSEPVLLQASSTGFGWTVRFSPLGTYIASPGLDGMARAWLVESANNLPEYACSRCDLITDVAYSPDEKYIALSDTSGSKVFVLDVRSGEELARADLPSPSQLEFSPDGKKLAAGSIGRPANIAVWDVPGLLQAGGSGQAPLVLESLEGTFACLEFSPDSRLLAYGTGWGGTQVRDVATGALVAKIETDCLAPRSMAFSRDGRLLSFLTRSVHQASYQTWDVASATLSKEVNLGLKDADEFSATLHPSGDLLAFVRKSGQGLAPVELVRLETGDVLLTLRGYGGRAASIAFSPDGTLLAATSEMEGSMTGRVIAVWRLGIPPIPVNQ